MAEKTPDVNKASDLSGTPLEIEQEVAGTVDAGLARDAKAQAEYDANWRSENPDKVLVREANPAVGGESFDYLTVNGN